jgi:hypothetical protein
LAAPSIDVVVHAPSYSIAAIIKNLFMLVTLIMFFLKARRVAIGAEAYIKPAAARS